MVVGKFFVAMKSGGQDGKVAYNANILCLEF